MGFGRAAVAILDRTVRFGEMRWFSNDFGDDGGDDGGGDGGGDG